MHTAGIAFLTLIINATTTGALVRYLGLSKQSDIKKNILVGVAQQLDKKVDHSIHELKDKPHFNNVDWSMLRDTVRMLELQKKLKMYKNLDLKGEVYKDFHSD